jgi:D-alanyl-D-alanine carboxypeptidase
MRIWQSRAALILRGRRLPSDAASGARAFRAATWLRHIGVALAVASLAFIQVPTNAAATAAKKPHVSEQASGPHGGKGSDKAGKAHAKAHGKHRSRPHRVVHGPDYHPPYSDIVVDGNSGQVLHETDSDAPRHPASLTKIMTLYLLFEQLEQGTLRLDTRLPISAFAASQTPTKLGLKPNDTISVEDAIKGLVTRSANDAAVVIAEAIAGSEADFAARMTRKAELLGMSHTVYVNASGLPADAQVTTARDQAVLGLAIQQHFPQYYGYFATPSFHFRRAEIGNHNALLREVEGCDGIKTGYTEASGYNLVSSVHRRGHYLVSVVLGGRSNAMRDARMRQLIEDHIGLASTVRTAPTIVDRVLGIGSGGQQRFVPASAASQSVPTTYESPLPEHIP